MQAIDLSALSAQAVAQVEKASQAAQQQLAAALQNKPKLALRLYLEAPKIAVPIASTPDGQGGVDCYYCPAPQTACQVLCPF